MSLFSNDLIEKDLIESFRESHDELLKAIVDYALCLPAHGAIIIETENPTEFIDRLESVITQAREMENDYSKLLEFPSALKDDEKACIALLRRFYGRRFVRWDVRTFHKGDAIGSMHWLSQQAYPKPIVTVMNITDITDNGDRTKFDTPELVENILLHSWKNDIISLTHPVYGPFQMNRTDYSVLFPVTPGSLSRLHHHPNGIAFGKF